MFKLLRFAFNHTLNSVYFGISLMVLIAAYIAVGSGLPAVRERFEMNEMQFFTAWPLILLSVLLIASLITVTFIRIPFTPPRYGVWTVHLGIITLVMGMIWHYHEKIEGLALVPMNRTVDHFYHNTERMLYLRINGVPVGGYPLPSLPRFKSYAPELGNTARLDRSDLQNIMPVIRLSGGGRSPAGEGRSRAGEARSPAGREQDHAGHGHPAGGHEGEGEALPGRGEALPGEVRVRPLGEYLGLKEPLWIDVVGYYPYADIITDFIEDRSAGQTGIKLTMTDPHSGGGRSPAGRIAETWLVHSDPQARARTVSEREVAHLHVADDGELRDAEQSARRFHRLDITAGGFADSLYVQPGRTYRLGDSGYTIEVEDFIPSFPMFGTGELVKILTLKVTAPDQVFRRQVLAGKPADLQTDFRLNVPEAGPFGQRQRSLLDEDLTILYTFEDPYRLLSSQAHEKHTLVTSGQSERIVQIITGVDRPAEVRHVGGGEGKISLCCPPAEDGPDEGHLALAVRRSDNLRREYRVEPVPPSQRTRQAGELGVYQVLVVRVSSGDWSQVIPVPFSQYANDVPWEEPSVTLAGTRARLQLQLGNSVMPLPVRITLDDFQLVFYQGGDHENPGTPRDFRSTLTIEDPRTGEKFTAVAHMNNPVYIMGGSALLFQAAWDPEGQKWTILGVGNRPAVWVMTAGCIMIALGLLYAFYVKPIIIRRMKAAALAEAARRKKPSAAASPAPAPAEEPVMASSVSVARATRP